MNQTHPVHANVAPVGGVYMMPPQQQENSTTPKRILQVRGIKGLSISLFVMSLLLGILGIITVIIEARRSYAGDPIWSGLGVLLPTAILGLLVYCKRKSLCTNVAFIVMTVLSALWQFQLGVWMIASVTGEQASCNPHIDYDSYFWDDENICQFPKYARLIVDIITVLVAFASSIICIILFSLTTYATFSCCHNCCKKGQSPTEYLPYSSVMMVPMGIQNNQGQVIHQDTSTGQPIVAGSITQSTIPQTVVVGGSPHQSTMPQPSVVAGASSQSTISQPVVVAGSPNQSTTQPLVVAGSAHQSTIFQPVIVAGSAPRSMIHQPSVIAGSAPPSTFHQPIIMSGSAPPSIFPQPIVMSGSAPQSTFPQPGIVAGSPHQSAIGQPVVVAGSVPHATTTQPLVVAGLPPSHIVDANGGKLSIQQPDANNAQNTSGNPQPNLSAQASGVTTDQLAIQPQNWEKF